MLSFFRCCLVFYINYAICFSLIYDICDYLVLGHVVYDIFLVHNILFMQLRFDHRHKSTDYKMVTFPMRLV